MSSGERNAIALNDEAKRIRVLVSDLTARISKLEQELAQERQMNAPLRGQLMALTHGNGSTVGI